MSNLRGFKRIGKEVRRDSKARILLGKLAAAERYDVQINETGEILLTPMKSIPAYEAWVFEDAETLKSLKRGIAQAKAGLTETYDPREWK